MGGELKHTELIWLCEICPGGIHWDMAPAWAKAAIVYADGMYRFVSATTPTINPSSMTVVRRPSQDADHE